MPTSARRPDLLVDTSVAVALCARDHEHHDATVRALGRRRLGLAGHAAFETFSVLTRMPPPARRSPQVVHHLLDQNFPANRFLSPGAAVALLRSFAHGAIAGGSVYDALVGACAAEHGITLATHDHRAHETYRGVGATIEVLASASG
jgi:predicted nucleic acid-binding protein